LAENLQWLFIIMSANSESTFHCARDKFNASQMAILRVLIDFVRIEETHVTRLENLTLSSSSCALYFSDFITVTTTRS
jgi:hypothetical protein